MGQDQPPSSQNTGQTDAPATLHYAHGSPWASAPSPEHLQQIAKAKVIGKKIRRAQSVATFSAWTTAIFAMVTIVFSLTSFWGLLLGIAMAVVSIVEFRGVNEIRRLDPTAPKRLAINQLAFGTLLFLYGAIALWQALYSPTGEMAEIAKELGQMGDAGNLKIGDVYTNMTRTILIAAYSGVMVAALLGPGLTAVYYYTRRRFIEEYVRQTPQWILDLQRAGMSI